MSFACIYICVLCYIQCLWRSDKGIRYLGSGTENTAWDCAMGPGNQTFILCKNKCYWLVSYHYSTFIRFNLQLRYHRPVAPPNSPVFCFSASFTVMPVLSLLLSLNLKARTVPSLKEMNSVSIQNRDSLVPVPLQSVMVKWEELFYFIIIRSTGKIKTSNKGMVFGGGLEVIDVNSPVSLIGTINIFLTENRL